MQTFRVKSGVEVEVCQANHRTDWSPFTTTKVNEFDEPISRTRSTVIFRSGRWMMRVKPHHVEMFNGLRWVRLK